MSIGFRDHEGFHRAAIGMTAAGAVAGSVGGAIGLAPIVGGAVGAVIGAAIAERSSRGRAARLGLGLVLAAAGAAIAGAMTGAGGLWIIGLAIGVALARGDGRAWLAHAAIGAVVATAGAFAASRIGGAAELAAWPAWLVGAAAGAAMALACVLALAPSRVTIARDPVAHALRGLPAKVDAEVRGLAEQGARVWGDVRGRTDEGARDLIKDGVLRLIEVAAKAERIPADVAADAARVASRIDELDARLAAATDEIARAQYAEARAALDDQRRYLDGIRASRERLVARMHNYLAALEKFRLCVVHVETASTAELELSGKALAELDVAAAA